MHCLCNEQILSRERATASNGSRGNYGTLAFRAPSEQRSLMLTVHSASPGFRSNPPSSAEAFSPVEMDVPAKLEFAVQMSCQKCEDDIKRVLSAVPGIGSVVVDRQRETVVVETATLPSAAVMEAIESTGRHVVLKGYGSSDGNLGSAVAMLSESSPDHSSGVRGVVRLVQVDPRICVAEGTLDGLKPFAKHSIAVHQYGDLSEGCSSCGDVMGQEASSRNDFMQSYRGCLGETIADAYGRLSFRFATQRLSILDTIGRSLLVHGPSMGEQQDTADGKPLRLACGVIARSAGLFENSKRICACDGLTLWDERDKPAAGSGRKNHPVPVPADAATIQVLPAATTQSHL